MPEIHVIHTHAWFNEEGVLIYKWWRCTHVRPTHTRTGAQLNEEVLLVYNQVPAPGDNGFDVKDIHAHLIQRGINVPYKDVKVAVDFLCNEGHLYSTSDDNHHKSAGV